MSIPGKALRRCAQESTPGQPLDVVSSHQGVTHRPDEGDDWLLAGMPGGGVSFQVVHSPGFFSEHRKKMRRGPIELFPFRIHLKTKRKAGCPSMMETGGYVHNLPIQKTVTGRKLVGEKRNHTVFSSAPPYLS